MAFFVKSYSLKKYGMTDLDLNLRPTSLITFSIVYFFIAMLFATPQFQNFPIP
ncbi:hypothetical protein Hac_0981 [Helicobacter acinonychis str. Sheeba]|uniref:Uncharacterized protein n=1 Tax=Helicobacter acinonychis (strain Sheeba) TaxID=382638 RepID=Q17X74_HELAH|nr:hypothetical protein Hac_0981 [Helicobacter acinonychis str. Sheeba]